MVSGEWTKGRRDKGTEGLREYNEKAPDQRSCYYDKISAGAINEWGVVSGEWRDEETKGRRDEGSKPIIQLMYDTHSVLSAGERLL